MSGALHVTIHRVVITMRLAPDRKSATGGVIAGVVAASDLATEVIHALCGDLSPIQSSIRAAMVDAADVPLDGVADPSRTCEGISIGIGFDAVAAKLGPVGASRRRSVRT